MSDPIDVEATEAEHPVHVPRNPVQPADIFTTDTTQRLRRRLAVVHPEAFGTGPGASDVQAYYEDALANALMEAEQVPGVGTMQDMAIEAYIYLMAQHKAHAMGAQGYSEAFGVTGPADYEKLIMRAERLYDTVTKVRSDRTAEETFKRGFVNTIMRHVTAVLEHHINDPDKVVAIQQDLIEQLRGAVTDEARARN